MDEERADQPIDLREYLSILRVRKWTIILTVLLVTGAALAFSFQQTPVYTSESRVLVQAMASNPNDFYLFPPNLETESEVVSSGPVAELVKDDLATTMSTRDLLSGLSVTSVVDSEVLIVKYTDEDPQFAQQASNSFTQSYLDYRVDQALEGLVAAQESIQRRVDAVREQLTDLSDRLDQARERQDEELVATLESERSVLLARLGVLQQRLDDVQPDPTVRLGGGNIIEQAEISATPSSPNHTQNGILGLALGLALGVALAFVRERLDDRFRGRTDVVRALGVPALATIPKHANAKKRKKDRTIPPVTLTEPRGTASESYRSLRTSIQFLAADRDIKMLVVTSPAAGEGKTVTASNLAIAFAQANSRTILVSADMRRPMLEEHFGIERQPGLSDWLMGTGQPATSLLKQHPEVENLRIMPVGSIPPNPAELLSSGRLLHLVSELAEVSDILIVDAPPTLPVADASILSAHAGGTVLVVDAGETKRSAAIHAKEELERVGGRVLGCVLNAYDPGAAYSYYDSGYYPQYYTDPSSENGKQENRRRSLIFRR